MAVTQYVGSRYVPVFAEPVEWSSTKSYEALTIVIHDGNSYTSKQAVPAGIDIKDEKFWALTGNYNAQVELYRQETAEAKNIAETANSVIPSSYFSPSNTVKNYIDANVSEIRNNISQINALIDGVRVYDITSYDGVTNDGVDCTAALQQAIASIPENSYVVFPNGTYRFSTLELNTNTTYDFQGSTIVFDSLHGIEVIGTEKGVKRLPEGYTRNQHTITLNNSTGISTGDLVKIVNENELFHAARANYYKGGVFEVQSINGNIIDIGESIPYDIESQGCYCYVYSPKTVHITNIGNTEYVGNLSGGAGVAPLYIEACKNSSVTNCNFTSDIYYQIAIYYCYSTALGAITCNITNTNKWQNTYPIGVIASNHTYIHNCYMINWWHCICVGGDLTNFDTNVAECVLFCRGQVPGYYDHENAIYTNIRNSVLSCFGVANSATVRDCRIYTWNTSLNNAFVCTVTPAMEYDYSNFTIENCSFHGRGENFNRNQILITYTQREGIPQQNCYLNRLYVVNCSYEGDIEFRVENGITAGNCRQITVEGCTGICPKLNNPGTHADTFIFSKTRVTKANYPILGTAHTVDSVFVNDIVVANDMTYYAWINIGSGVKAFLKNIYIESGHSTPTLISVSSNGTVFIENMCDSSDNSPRRLLYAANNSTVFISNSSFPSAGIYGSDTGVQMFASNFYDGSYNQIINALSKGGKNYLGTFSETDLRYNYTLR